MDIASLAGFILGVVMFIFGILSNGGVAALGNIYNFPSLIITFGGSISGVLASNKLKDFISGFKAIGLIFTDKVIELLNKREQPIVFILWGNNAKQKMKLITNPNHLILQAAHPSPLSAFNGFFGCKHFSKTNDFLANHGIAPIDWRIE